MANSNLKIVSILLLLLVTPLILLAMPITAQEGKQTRQPMITGILAHEMNENYK